MLLRPCRPGLIGRPRGLVSAWAPPVAGSAPPDPAAVAAALVIAGFSSPPSAPRQTAIYNLINALMSTPAVAATPGVSIWASRDRLCVYRASEAQGARINWITPGTGDSAVNGTGGTFTADVGYSGADASNNIVFCGNPSTDFVKGTRNNNSFGAATSTDANDVVSSAIAGSTMWSIQPRTSTGVLSTRSTTTSADTSAGANSGTNVHTLCRISSTAYERYNGGTLFDSPTRSSIAINTAPIYLNTHNLTNFSNKPTGLVHFGSYMDAAAVAAFSTAWAAYVAAL